jgi:hypothetical protein
MNGRLPINNATNLRFHTKEDDISFGSKTFDGGVDMLHAEVMERLMLREAWVDDMYLLGRRKHPGAYQAGDERLRHLSSAHEQ